METFISGLSRLGVRESALKEALQDKLSSIRQSFDNRLRLDEAAKLIALSNGDDDDDDDDDDGGATSKLTRYSPSPMNGARVDSRTTSATTTTINAADGSNSVAGSTYIPFDIDNYVFQGFKEVCELILTNNHRLLVVVAYLFSLVVVVLVAYLLW